VPECATALGVNVAVPSAICAERGGTPKKRIITLKAEQTIPPNTFTLREGVKAAAVV